MIGIFGALVVYVGCIYGLFILFINVRVDLMMVLVSFERVFEVFDVFVSLVDWFGAVVLVVLEGWFMFEHVSFCYFVVNIVSVVLLELFGGLGVLLGEFNVEVFYDIDLMVEFG